MSVQIFYAGPGCSCLCATALQTGLRHAALRLYLHSIDVLRHLQGTLQVSDTQVSPVEIEKALLENPRELTSDVTVAGVSGGHTSEEKVPKAWVVLSNAGKAIDAEAVKREAVKWHQENLSTVED